MVNTCIWQKYIKSLILFSLHLALYVIFIYPHHFCTTVIIHLYYNLCLCIGCFICVVYAVKSLSKPEYGRFLSMDCTGFIFAWRISA